jgi:amino acid permease
MYLKRKLYALGCMATWLFMMKHFYVVLAHHINIIPSTGFDPAEALSTMYWCFPPWAALFLFWHISPQKDPFSDNDKMSRKQQKMIDEATRHQIPRF